MGYCRVNSEKTDRRIFARKRFEDKQKHKFYFSGKGSRASDPFRARAKSPGKLLILHTSELKS